MAMRLYRGDGFSSLKGNGTSISTSGTNFETDVTLTVTFATNYNYPIHVYEMDGGEWSLYYDIEDATELEIEYYNNDQYKFEATKEAPSMIVQREEDEFIYLGAYDKGTEKEITDDGVKFYHDASFNFEEIPAKFKPLYYYPLDVYEWVPGYGEWDWIGKIDEDEGGEISFSKNDKYKCVATEYDGMSVQKGTGFSKLNARWYNTKYEITDEGTEFGPQGCRFYFKSNTYRPTFESGYSYPIKIYQWTPNVGWEYFVTVNNNEDYTIEYDSSETYKVEATFDANIYLWDYLSGTNYKTLNWKADAQNLSKQINSSCIPPARPGYTFLNKWQIGLTENTVDLNGYVSISKDSPSVNLYARWQQSGKTPFYYGGTSKADDEANYVKTGLPVSNITATAWNTFQTRVHEQNNSYVVSNVSSGDTITATIVNNLRAGIDGMSPHGTLPDAVSSGDSLTASWFNTLRDAYNQE